MNTNDEKIQWHPAFDAALQIELGEETKYLEFDSEHLLSKKPMQIDVLVKNERHVKIQKNIGRIFRQYNIVEYKSPEDDLNIDDFYKVYAYACIYKADTETVDLHTGSRADNYFCMLPLSKNHAPEIAKRSADNSRKYGKRYLLPYGRCNSDAAYHCSKII